MRTWTDIVNKAFDLLSEPAIADVDQDPPVSALAGRAARLHKSEADYVLRMRRWPWAERAVVLGADGGEGAGFPGYQATIDLPRDCRRVNAVYPGPAAAGTHPGHLFDLPRIDWRRVKGAAGASAGRIAVACAPPVTVYYNAFDAPEALGPELSDLIAARLAYMLSNPQSGSRSKQRDAKQDFQEAFIAARAAAAAEGDPHQRGRRGSNWLDAASSGTF
jgi:hypothetical protein